MPGALRLWHHFETLSSCGSSHQKIPPVHPFTLLWAFLGLLLTLGGTFLEVDVALPTVVEGRGLGLMAVPLLATAQIGAVLLIGCVGGPNAGAVSQIAYLVLGLSRLPIFSQGGGWLYWQEPTFGYLLGFIPAAWITGLLAFRESPSLESLGVSCIGGLLTLHLFGVVYLTGACLLGKLTVGSLLQTVWQFTFVPLPSQGALVCAVTLLAYGLRRLLLM
jgi:biotin transport system substrate-specific component